MSRKRIIVAIFATIIAACLIRVAGVGHEGDSGPWWWGWPLSLWVTVLRVVSLLTWGAKLGLMALPLAAVVYAIRYHTRAAAWLPRPASRPRVAGGGRSPRRRVYGADSGPQQSGGRAPLGGYVHPPMPIRWPASRRPAPQVDRVLHVAAGSSVAWL
jgi:hypothetical protein